MIISEKKKRHNSIPFDPKAALFVANRFDLVTEESREKVKEHILATLAKCYPEFDTNNTVFFSTKSAKRDISANPEYINDNYKELLQKLSGLHSYAMERRLHVYYK